MQLAASGSSVLCDQVDRFAKSVRDAAAATFEKIKSGPSGPLDLEKNRDRVRRWDMPSYLDALRR